MSESGTNRTVILGYGNPCRTDDGLGPALASAIESWNLPGLDVEAAYQPSLEDAAVLASHARAIFVDASVNAPEPYELRPVIPARTIAFSSHALEPESVVAICEECFQPAPEAWVLAVRGYDFELGEGLTPMAERNLNEALECIRALLSGWRT